MRPFQSLWCRVSGVKTTGAALEKKLAEIVLPEVLFTGASLEEMIEFCARRSRELDPEGLGVNMIATPLAPDDGRRDSVLVDLNLRDIPLGDLLGYVGRMSGRVVSVEPHSVVFRPAGSQLLYNRSYPIEDAKMEEVLAKFGESLVAEQEDPFGGGITSDGGGRDAGAWLRAAGVPFPEGASALYEPFSGQLVVRNSSTWPWSMWVC